MTTTAVAEVPATCVSTGTTAGTKCKTCGKVLSGMETIAINPNNHTSIESVSEIPATCESDGVTAGKRCTGCNTIIEGMYTIPKLSGDACAVSEEGGKE